MQQLTDDSHFGVILRTYEMKRDTAESLRNPAVLLWHQIDLDIEWDPFVL